MPTTLARNTDLTADEIAYVFTNSTKSYRELAKKLNVSQSTVARVYRGEGRYAFLNDVPRAKFTQAVKVITDLGGRITF